jgi:hypothetical protein
MSAATAASTAVVSSIFILVFSSYMSCLLLDRSTMARRYEHSARASFAGDADSV